MWHLFPEEAGSGFPWTDVALCLPDTASVQLPRAGGQGRSPLLARHQEGQFTWSSGPGDPLLIPPQPGTPTHTHKLSTQLRRSKEAKRETQKAKIHTNCEIICSSSVKNTVGSLIGIALNL